MTNQIAAEFLSLLLSWPAIALSVLVVVWWGSQSLTSLGKRNPSSSELFAMGVAVGFLGEILDSAYWTIPWSMAFVESPHTGAWMSKGVYFNIVFRQLFTIAAATLHVQSYIQFVEEKRGYSGHLHTTLVRVAVGSCLLGLAYVTALSLFR